MAGPACRFPRSGPACQPPTKKAPRLRTCKRGALSYGVAMRVVESLALGPLALESLALGPRFPGLLLRLFLRLKVAHQYGCDFSAGSHVAGLELTGVQALDKALLNSPFHGVAGEIGHLAGIGELG